MPLIITCDSGQFSTSTTLIPPHPPIPLQVPRLTAVLRGLANDPASSFDPDAAFIERQKTLAARQQQQQQSGSSGGAGAAGGQQRSKLAKQLLGDWSKGEPTGTHMPPCTYSAACKQFPDWPAPT